MAKDKQNMIYSITDNNEGFLCVTKGHLCYNPTCFLNGKCCDFITREAYIKQKIEGLTKDLETLSSLRANALGENANMFIEIDRLNKYNKELIEALMECNLILRQRVAGYDKSSPLFQKVYSLTKSQN